MNALKCRTLSICIAGCACTYQWRGKWLTCIIAVPCWKGSSSSMELFQRKSHKISLLYCAFGTLCHFMEQINILQASLGTDQQTYRQTTQLQYTHCACAPRVIRCMKGHYPNTIIMLCGSIKHYASNLITTSGKRCSVKDSGFAGTG